MTALKSSVLLGLVAIAVGVAQAQNVPIEIDETSGLYTYQEVLDAPGVEADELFLRAQRWAVVNYRSANDVIQLEDREQAVLVLKGAYPDTHLMYRVHFRHTLAIECRDGRARVTYTQFEFDVGIPHPFESKNIITAKNRALRKVAEHVTRSRDDLKIALNSSRDEDW